MARITAHCSLPRPPRCSFPILALHPREDLPPRPAAPLPARFVDPRPHLRDARVGPEHCDRARWPAGPRLRRLLCGRRLRLALLAVISAFGFWICLPLAVLAALWAFFLGFPVLGLHGDYLAIVTLAFGEIIRIVLHQLDGSDQRAETASRYSEGDPLGLPFKPSEDGTSPLLRPRYAPLHAIHLSLLPDPGSRSSAAWSRFRLRRLPIGRAWEAMREDEIACRSLGINTTNAKLTAFATGAMFGGFAGAFFATGKASSARNPSPSWSPPLSSPSWCSAAWAARSAWCFAAIVMIGGFELLRNMEWLQIVFGQDFDPIALPHAPVRRRHGRIMLWRPRGIISSREPSIVLNERARLVATWSRKGAA